MKKVFLVAATALTVVFAGSPANARPWHHHLHWGWPLIVADPVVVVPPVFVAPRHVVVRHPVVRHVGGTGR